MENFWKTFFTLFGIGAAISVAKSLKSKKGISEVVSEIIISGFFATGAAIVYIFYPTIPFIVVVGIASILTILGVNFFSTQIEKVIDRYLPVKKDSEDIDGI
jgi:diacylglycerol kinase